jgi:hypothetical protein
MTQELFLAIVNKVTSYHRHGQSIPKSALDRLSNAQLEMEAALKTGGTQPASPNIRMLDEASQICQPIVSDIMDFFVRSTGCFEHLSRERKDEIRDNLYRIVVKSSLLF